MYENSIKLKLNWDYKKVPISQFRSYKNGMHQKINPSLPENWHSFYKYDTSSAISAIGFLHVCKIVRYSVFILYQVWAWPWDETAVPCQAGPASAVDSRLGGEGHSFKLVRNCLWLVDDVDFRVGLSLTISSCSRGQVEGWYWQEEAEGPLRDPVWRPPDRVQPPRPEVEVSSYQSPKMDKYLEIFRKIFISS